MLSIRDKEWRFGFVRWLRLGAYVLVLCSLSTWWLLHRASAAVTEHSLEVGRELAKMKELMAGTTIMELNGERMTLTSASSEHDVGTILDRFGATCAEQSGGVTEELEALVEGGARFPENVKPKSALVLRSQKDAREGASACFARSGEGGLRDLTARLTRTVESGEFGSLGELRYVFARRKEGSSSTHVIAVRAHSALALAKMFPESGDAPGADLFAGARPADARRIVSAKVDGTRHHATIYQTARPAEQALRDFDAPLSAQGFHVGDLSVVDGMNAIPTRVFIKPDDTVVVVADPEVGDDGQVSVSAFRLLNGGYVPMQP